MVPKICVTFEKVSNKSCSELNFVENSPRACMSIFPTHPKVEFGARKTDMVEILYSNKRKRFKIKIVQNSIFYKN